MKYGMCIIFSSHNAVNHKAMCDDMTANHSPCRFALYKNQNADGVVDKKASCCAVRRLLADRATSKQLGARPLPASPVSWAIIMEAQSQGTSSFCEVHKPCLLMSI